MPTTEQPTEQVEATLPEGAKEETREQFEKLKEHNRQMAQKLAQYEQQKPQFNSVLDEMPVQSQAFSNLSNTQVEDITKNLVDENGYIDQDLLNRTLQSANERAQRAEDRAMLAEQRVEEFEVTQTVRDVHTQHPSLNPRNPSFNKDFYDAVKTEIGSQMKKGYQDFQAAADKVAAEFAVKSQASGQTQKAQEEAQQKVISQREQASGVTGRSKGTSSDQYEDDEEGVRKGDALSIGQKLQANGY